MKKNIVLRIINIILVAFLLVVLFVNSVILISSIIKPNEVPSFFGWKPFITLSGSMETEIFAGDLAVVKTVDPKELKEGDIIAFRQDDIVITHRIAQKIEENGTVRFVTKGDNNNVEDIVPVYENMVEGKYMFRVAKLGNVAMFMQTPLETVIVLAVPVLLLILIQCKKNKDSEQETGVNGKKMQEELERLKEENRKLAEAKRNTNS